MKKMLVKDIPDETFFVLGCQSRDLANATLYLKDEPFVSDRNIRYFASDSVAKIVKDASECYIRFDRRDTFGKFLRKKAPLTEVSPRMTAFLLTKREGLKILYSFLKKRIEWALPFDGYPLHPRLILGDQEESGCGG
jgi:hypothetical protein